MSDRPDRRRELISLGWDELTAGRLIRAVDEDAERLLEILEESLPDDLTLSP